MHSVAQAQEASAPFPASFLRQTYYNLTLLYLRYLVKKLSLRKLADIADVDFSQIHRIEKGETNPSLTMIIALAEALNIGADELVIFK